MSDAAAFPQPPDTGPEGSLPHSLAQRRIVNETNAPERAILERELDAILDEWPRAYTHTFCFVLPDFEARALCIGDDL